MGYSLVQTENSVAAYLELPRTYVTTVEATRLRKVKKGHVAVRKVRPVMREEHMRFATWCKAGCQRVEERWVRLMVEYKVRHKHQVKRGSMCQKRCWICTPNEPYSMRPCAAIGHQVVLQIAHEVGVRVVCGHDHRGTRL